MSDKEKKLPGTSIQWAMRTSTNTTQSVEK